MVKEVKLDDQILIFGEWQKYDTNVWALPLANNQHNFFEHYPFYTWEKDGIIVASSFPTYLALDFTGICKIYLSKLYNTFYGSICFNPIDPSYNAPFDVRDVEMWKIHVSKFLQQCNLLKVFI